MRSRTAGRSPCGWPTQWSKITRSRHTRRPTRVGRTVRGRRAGARAARGRQERARGRRAAAVLGEPDAPGGRAGGGRRGRDRHLHADGSRTTWTRSLGAMRSCTGTRGASACGIGSCTQAPRWRPSRATCQPGTHPREHRAGQGQWGGDARLTPARAQLRDRFDARSSGWTSPTQGRWSASTPGWRRPPAAPSPSWWPGSTPTTCWCWRTRCTSRASGRSASTRSGPCPRPSTCARTRSRRSPPCTRTICRPGTARTGISRPSPSPTAVDASS